MIYIVKIRIFPNLINNISNGSKNRNQHIRMSYNMYQKERNKFKKGVGRIYDSLKVKCQPVAINSGYVWPKGKPISRNKVITVSILKGCN